MSEERIALLERNHATLEVTLNKLLEVVNHAINSQGQKDPQSDASYLQPGEGLPQGQSERSILRDGERRKVEGSGSEDKEKEKLYEEVLTPAWTLRPREAAMPFEERISFGDVGYIFIDDNHQTWWVPYGKTPELLADADSVCGCSFFNTGYQDKLRTACDWHDKMYRGRAQSEKNGWDRLKIDSYFKELMMTLAAGDPMLVIKVKLFYMFVRMVGGLFYYRHPGYEATK